MTRLLDASLVVGWIAAVVLALVQPWERVSGPPASWKTEPVRISDWGPRSTPEGKVFNRQPDGDSVLWIKATGVTADSRTRVLFAGSYLNGVSVQDTSVTVAIPRSLLAPAGWREVEVLAISYV